MIDQGPPAGGYGPAAASAPMTAETGTPPPRRYPLAPLVTRWNQVLEKSKTQKDKEFGQWAEEAMNFFDGPSNWMWQSINSTANRSGDFNGQHEGFLQPGAHLPQFQMSVNRLFEAVALFGPALYHQAPSIAVVPRLKPPVSIEAYYASDPQKTEILSMIPSMKEGVIADENLMNVAMQLEQEYETIQEREDMGSNINETHAAILESLSNYAQQEGAKLTDGRMAITEAIITGIGILETRVETPPGGGPKMPRSRFRTHKDLLVDPDAKYWRDVTWIALRSTAPVNQVEDEFNLPPGSLKGDRARSSNVRNPDAIASPRNGNGQPPGITHDILEYWTVYSKNGAGQHIKTSGSDKRLSGLDVFGDYVKLVIAKNVKYPLNLSPQVLATGDQDLILEQASWEVPFWDDYAKDGGWPISRLCFYNKPGYVWPISMCKPVIGQMRFVNWCMSFIADKVAAGSRMYIGTMKSAGESIRSQLTGGSGPYTVLEVEKILGNNINDMVSFLKSPDFGIDIWKMVAEVNDQIDKGLGLTELIYGMSTRQMRSATEANVKQEAISIRPDDMAQRTEEWLATSATREIQAYRFLCEYEDVLPIIGPTAAQVYQEQILTDEVSRITRDFTYQVVAGSAKKPNKMAQIERLTEFGQYFLPVAQQAMSMGVTEPLNAYLEKMGKAMDMDVSDFLIGDSGKQTLMQAIMAQQQQQQAELEQREQMQQAELEQRERESIRKEKSSASTK